MDKKQARNISLGILVLSGTIILILGLYFIGSKQNLFGNTISVSVSFRNVNGLMAGNNVRYSGINIGTVESVQIISDSGVVANMLIEKGPASHIKTNSIAMIGTDGLMGNKLINITPMPGDAPALKDGDEIFSKDPIETEEMFRTLNRTNEDIAVIVQNLRVITDKLTNSNTIWSMLLDPEVAKNMKNAIVNIKLTSERSATLTGDLALVVKDLKNGKGTMGALLTDPTMEKRIRQTMVNIQYVSDTLLEVSGDMHQIMKQAHNKDATIGMLLMDTAFANDLRHTMKNANAGSKEFTTVMGALKQNSLIKKYLKKSNK